MRIIVTFEIGDGCTYACTETIPIEYESCEQALVDFEKELFTTEYKFEIFGKIFDRSMFYLNGKYYPPEFLSVDEWFERELS